MTIDPKNPETLEQRAKFAAAMLIEGKCNMLSDASVLALCEFVYMLDHKELPSELENGSAG